MHDLMPLDESWVTWRERFAWHMREVPNLVGEILKHRNPMRAARYDRELVDGSGAEGTPAPMNVDVVDDADALWVALLDLASTVDGWLHTDAEVLGDAVPSADGVGSSFVDRMPAVAASKRGGVFTGVHPSLDEAAAFDQAQSVVRWLVRQSGEIRKRPALVQAATEAEPLIRRLRQRYLVDRKRAGRPMQRRCKTCGEVAVIVEWAEMVARDKAFGVGRCAKCGQLYVELR